MKKANKELLKQCAGSLFFTMSEEEYVLLLNDFDILEKQIALFSNVEELDDAEPLVFPYDAYSLDLREDVIEEELNQSDALKNAHDVKDGMIVIPKVVK